MSHKFSNSLAGRFSLSISRMLQSKWWPGLQSSGGLTRAGGLTSCMAHLQDLDKKSQFPTVCSSPQSCLIRGLCPHKVAAGSPPNQKLKRTKWKLWWVLWPGLERHTLSSQQHPICSISHFWSKWEGSAQRPEYQGIGIIEEHLGAGYYDHL